jgi:site-specific recombinase XerD
VLRAWLLKCPGTVVFPNQAGSMHGESAHIFQEILHRVLDDAGFPKLGEGDHQRRYIRFHDLRHTFASHWMMNGGDLFKLQRILGHKSVTMTQRYAHLAPEAFAADHGRLGGQNALAEGVVVQLSVNH